MITLTFDELLSYTEEEREKWHAWLQAQPAALDISLQPGGRFATVGALVDHIFLVEARHLARLRNEPVPDASGVTSGDVDGLFNYGCDVRRALRAYVADLSDSDAGSAREFVVQSGAFRMTPRKLLIHIGVHETRHWAQIALGIRQAGLAPPGNHDFFYSRAFE
jgi:uncharacterized damage-inducible protein DinB